MCVTHISKYGELNSYYISVSATIVVSRQVHWMLHPWIRTLLLRQYLYKLNRSVPWQFSGERVKAITWNHSPRISSLLLTDQKLLSKCFNDSILFLNCTYTYSEILIAFGIGSIWRKGLKPITIVSFVVNINC